MAIVTTGGDIYMMLRIERYREREDFVDEARQSLEELIEQLERMRRPPKRQRRYEWFQLPLFDHQDLYNQQAENEPEPTDPPCGCLKP